MKTIRILFFLSLLVITTAVFAQPFSIAFEETGLTQYAFDVPLDSVCGGTTSPIADGTIVKIYHDVDQDGPDATDPLAPLCDDPPNCFLGTPGLTHNLNEFPFNGTELGIGTGYFMMQTLFTSIADLPIPSKFYLRVCLPGRRYVSPVYTIASGYAQTQECTWACEDSSCPGCEPPPPPTGFTASDSTLCTGVQLRWSYPATLLGFPVDSFFVYRGGVLIGGTVRADTSYLDAAAPTGQTLAYTVKARRNCGAAGTALSIAAADNGSVYPPPTVPDAISASYDTCNYVRVRWRYTSGSGTESFRIKRNDTTVTTQAVTGNPGWRTWDHYTTDPATANYTVVGYSTICGEGTPSAADPGYALQPPTVEPDSVRATLGLCNTTFVYWRNVAGATAHRIYRFNTSGGDSTYLGAVPVSPYSDTNSPAGITYRYRVAAQNTCGTGRLSTEFANGFRVRKVNQVRNVSASDSTNCDTVTVTWGDIAMEDSFKVIRVPVAGGTADTIARLAADVWVFYDVNATPGVRYNYRLLGKNICGNGDTLSTANEGSRKAPPGQVQNVQASDSLYCWGVRVTWNDVAREDSFLVKRDGNPLRWRPAGSSSHTFDDSTALVGNSYSYTVQAKNRCGDGLESTANVGNRKDRPGQVLGVSATDSSCLNIVITWGNVSGEDSFRVLRNNAVIGAVGPNILSFTDNPPAGTYAYRILAKNACGNADTSAADSGRREILTLPVTGVNASDDLCFETIVSWNSLANVDSFVIRRNGGRIGRALSNDTSYSDATGQPGVRYAYTVQACNVCGVGPASSPDSGSRIVAPVKPTGLIASQDLCDAIVLSWNDVDFESLYIIRRNGIIVGFVDKDTTRYTDYPSQGSYNYTVQAINDCGGSPVSTSVVGKRLSIPVVNFLAVEGLCQTVALDWTQSANPDWIRIYRNNVLIDSAGSAVLHYEDHITAAGDYSYHLTAVNSCGISASSDTLTATVNEFPQQPQNLIFSDNHCEQITLNWTGASGSFNRYRIYRNGWLCDSVLSSANSYHDNNVIGGDSYTYHVTAFSDTCGEGVPSDVIVAALTEIAPPSAPNIFVTVSGNDAVLRWNSISTSDSGCPVVVTGYLVFYSPTFDGPYYFHGFTADTTYSHGEVVRFAPGMFYDVRTYSGPLAIIAELPDDGTLPMNEVFSRLRNIEREKSKTTKK